MKDNRLRAPSTDGALLAVPALDQVDKLFSHSARVLAGWDHDFQGRRAGRLRAQVHHEVLQGARRFLREHGLDVPDVALAGAPSTHLPLVVTGHQPELFHPGVWVKNFAAAALARARGGVGLNLIVDNDLPKSSTIRVPRVLGEMARALRVEFDQWRGEAPYEDLPVHDESIFASFSDRVLDVLGDSIPDPLIAEFWPHAIAKERKGLPFGLMLGYGRRSVEASWGASNLEIPLSRVCQTEGYYWFACHILAQLPRFIDVHNRALNGYRAQYGIRSKNHPVPALQEQDGWREAPFWAWRRGNPRRRPLLVKQLARTMLLRVAGEDDPLVELPLAADREACCAVERLAEVAAGPVRIRTRALTTTMFARHLLGDFFIHGIGGARYDELGDTIAREFFGIEPPGFLTLSMTLFPGLPNRPSPPNVIATIERRIRDVRYHPDRYLSEPISPEHRRLMERKRQAIFGPVGTRRERVDRYHAIRTVNESLSPLLADLLGSLQVERSEALAAFQWNRVVRSRDYSMVVHPARRLRRVMTDLMPSLCPPR